MTDPSTLLEMDLPDEAIDAAIDAYDAFDGPAGGSMDAAIRAALQALCDCGMAEYHKGVPGYSFEQITIRLSPQRKEKEQT